MHRFLTSSIGVTLLLALLTPLFVVSTALAQPQTVGFFTSEPGAQGGYTLFSPMRSTETFLIDSYGRQVHSWPATDNPNNSVYLLENGNILRPQKTNTIQIIDWDGNLVWDYVHPTDLVHHDVAYLPSGNVLIIVRETKTEAEALQAGRDPALLSTDGLKPEAILEIQPTGPTTGNVVWEWHAWDHLVQDYDVTKDNYGVVEDHPELFDINFDDDARANFLHFNGMDYNEDLDQIIVSARLISEFWIIDHSTSTAEASSHAGGTTGKGGDLLYRWGNPAAYRGGTAADRTLFRQHDAHWIDEGLPGAGDILIYSNGDDRTPVPYSTVEEMTPPTVDANGNYPTPPSGAAHLPAAPIWTYAAAPPESLLSGLISGAQRLPNGNTLFCDGPAGHFIEVDLLKTTLWRYVNPISNGVPMVQGDTPDNNAVFRCYRYQADYPGLAGRDLSPQGPLEIYPIAIAGTAHAPTEPTELLETYVTASIVDDIAVTDAQLWYSDGGAFISTPMFDDGTHGDGLAGDDIYGAAIPSHPAGTEIGYYIVAEDGDLNDATDPPPAPIAVYSYTVLSCCQNLVGDANGSGENEPTIGDVSIMIEAKFISGTCDGILDCLSEADVNQSGGAAPVCDDITIGDVSLLIDYLFITGPESFGPLNDCL